MNPIGRPRVLTYQLQDEVCDRVARGETIVEAAHAVGVSARTVQRYAKHDDRFNHKLRLARHSTPDCLRVMQVAARTHWRAAAWLLERTNPERYARRSPSSASPTQLLAALRLVAEAALEKVDPRQRPEVFDQMQQAADEAFDRVFPHINGWARHAGAAPATPLVVEQLTRQSKDTLHDRIVDDCPVTLAAVAVGSGQ